MFHNVAETLDGSESDESSTFLDDFDTKTQFRKETKQRLRYSKTTMSTKYTKRTTQKRAHTHKERLSEQPVKGRRKRTTAEKSTFGRREQHQSGAVHEAGSKSHEKSEASTVSAGREDSNSLLDGTNSSNSSEIEEEEEEPRELTKEEYEKKLSGFKLRSKPFKQEDMSFQKDVFFDYMEMLLTDFSEMSEEGESKKSLQVDPTAKALEEYLNYKPKEVTKLVNLVAWLNRQYVINSFLEQNLSFHSDFLTLYKVAKRKDELKYHQTLSRTLTRALAKARAEGHSETKEKLLERLKRNGKNGLTTHQDKDKNLVSLRQKSREMTLIENKVLGCIDSLTIMFQFFRDVQVFTSSIQIIAELIDIEVVFYEKRRPQYAQTIYELANVILLQELHVSATKTTPGTSDSEAMLMKAIVEAERLLGKKQQIVANWLSNFGLEFQKHVSVALRTGRTHALCSHLAVYCSRAA